MLYIFDANTSNKYLKIPWCMFVDDLFIDLDTIINFIFKGKSRIGIKFARLFPLIGLFAHIFNDVFSPVGTLFLTLFVFR